MLNKIVVFLALVICFGSINAKVGLPTEQYKPPYPDVWGYDLSEYPAIKWGGGGVQAYQMDDGDIWFIVNIFYKEDDPLREDVNSTYSDEKYVLIKFFKGEKIQLNAEERKHLDDILPNQVYVNHEKLHFSDDSTLQRYMEHISRFCSAPNFSLYSFVKTTANKQEIKYSILGGHPHVTMKFYQANCDIGEMDGEHFLYEKLYSFDNIIDLKDDTFIVFSENLILRFDKDLKTKFEPTNPIVVHYGNYIPRNFFVIEYAIIEDIEKKVIEMHGRNFPIFQATHDELLAYLESKHSTSAKQ